MKKLIFLFTIVISLSLSNIFISSSKNGISVSIQDLFDNAIADSECTQCVVKNIWGTIIFSCKPTPDVNECSSSGGGYSVSCDNATECGD